MRNVREIIKLKGPHSNFINADDTVLTAAAVMKSKNISYLIVRKNGNIQVLYQKGIACIS